MQSREQFDKQFLDRDARRLAFRLAPTRNAFDGLAFEVHISNVQKREAFRHHPFVSAHADGVIAGFGSEGHRLALRRVATSHG